MRAATKASPGVLLRAEELDALDAILPFDRRDQLINPRATWLEQHTLSPAPASMAWRSTNAIYRSWSVMHLAGL